MNLEALSDSELRAELERARESGEKQRAFDVFIELALRMDWEGA